MLLRSQFFTLERLPDALEIVLTAHSHVPMDPALRWSDGRGVSPVALGRPGSQ